MYDIEICYAYSSLGSRFAKKERAAILPAIATERELHAANSLTQTTQWTTLAIGTFLGGASVMGFGYRWAFFCNSLSFLISALCISRLRLAGRGFRAPRRALTENECVGQHSNQCHAVLSV